MGTFDGRAFGQEIVSVVKDYLERNLSPVLTRVEQLEARILLLEAQVGTVKDKPTVRITAGSRPAE